MSEQPPPGFYVDPDDSTHLRWWDGAAWGEQRQLIAPAASPAAELSPPDLAPAAAPPVSQEQAEANAAALIAAQEEKAKKDGDSEAQGCLVLLGFLAFLALVRWVLGHFFGIHIG